MLLAAILLLAPVLLILWHDLWIEPGVFSLEKPGGLSARVGSGEPLVSSEPVSSDDRFATRLIVDARGSREFAPNSRAEGGYREFVAPLTAPGGAILALTTFPRTITLEPAKFQAYVVEEGLAEPDDSPPASPITEEYCKHAKALVGVGPGLRDVWLQPAELDLEIVPQQVHFETGRQVDFQVLFRGAPVSGFGLWHVREGGRKTRHLTDTMGIATITFDTPGKAVLKGILMQSVDSPALRRKSWWCSLCLEVT